MGATQVGVARYMLDPGISRLQVRAFATGMLAGFGHNPTFSVRDFAGEIHIPPNGLAEASLELLVKAASLAVSDDIKDKDRRRYRTTHAPRGSRIGGVSRDRIP